MLEFVGCTEREGFARWSLWAVPAIMVAVDIAFLPQTRTFATENLHISKLYHKESFVYACLYVYIDRIL